MQHEAQYQTVEHAILHFRELRKYRDDSAPFNLQMALGTVLSLVSRSTVTAPGWGPPNTRQYERLLGSVYEGLGNAIVELGDRIDCDHLRDGMLAAAAIVCDLNADDMDTDRHRDNVSRVKMLIHRARIIEHENDIESRRRKRERAAVAKMLPSKSVGDEVFG